MSVLEELQEQLRGVIADLIMKVMGYIDEAPETEALFTEWADAMNNGPRERAEAAWEKLKPHIRFTS